MMQRALLGLGNMLLGMSLGVLLGLLIPHDPEWWGMFVIAPLVFWAGMSLLSLQLDFPRWKLLVLLLLFVVLNLVSVFLFWITFSFWAVIAAGLVFWAVKGTLDFKTYYVFVAASLVMLVLCVLMNVFSDAFIEFYLGEYDPYEYYPFGQAADDHLAGRLHGCLCAPDTYRTPPPPAAGRTSIQIKDWWAPAGAAKI